MRRSSSPSGEAQQANKSQKRSQHSSPATTTQSPEASTTAASSVLPLATSAVEHHPVTASILSTTISSSIMQRDTGLMTPDPDNDFESLPTYAESNATAATSGLHNVVSIHSDIAMTDNMVTDSEPGVTTAAHTITSTTLQAPTPTTTTTDLPTPRADTPPELTHPPTTSTTQPQTQTQTQQSTTWNSTSNQTQNQPQIRTHQPTGYRWTREEDAPSYLWRSAKAQEEMDRALGLIVDREKVVGRRYGDIGMSK